MLRPVNDSDFEFAYDFYMDSRVNPFMSFEVMSKGDFKDIWDELKGSSFFLAFDDQNKNLVGLCTLKKSVRRSAHVARLGSLVVNPSLQRQGIGKSFMKELFRFSLEKGIRRLDLMVEEDNVQAINFYKKLDFVEEGRLSHYFKRESSPQFVSEVLMAKFLSG